MSGKNTFDTASSLTLSDSRIAFRHAGVALAVLTALTAFAIRAKAQETLEGARFEVRPVVGVFVPTGDQSDLLEARDNVSAFKGLRGELDERKAHNDLQFSGGLTFRF